MGDLAEWNPLSALVAATRDLFGNPQLSQSTAWPIENPLAASLLWMVVILAIFMPLAVRQYKKAASQ